MRPFDRYSLDNLFAVFEQPSLLLYEINQLGVELNVQIHSHLDQAGDPIINRDWDNLLILDGCRYDLYQSLSQEQGLIDGQLKRTLSAGSESWEFMEANFADRKLHDIVYVTANPHATTLADDTFHAVVNLLDEGWDQEFQTVLPETVVEAAKQTHRDYPQKRLIIHFMQPHFPFIGKEGQRIEQKGLTMHLNEYENTHQQVWSQLRYGWVDLDQVWHAYRENLEIVLRHVKSLLEELSGKSVITSDHGNLIGERTWPLPARGYGHPPGLQVPQLLTVPWHIIESGERRTIVSEPPESIDQLDEKTVEQRLKSLGYR